MKWLGLFYIVWALLAIWIGYKERERVWFVVGLVWILIGTGISLSIIKGVRP